MPRYYLTMTRRQGILGVCSKAGRWSLGLQVTIPTVYTWARSCAWFARERRMRGLTRGALGRFMPGTRPETSRGLVPGAGAKLCAEGRTQEYGVCTERYICMYVCIVCTCGIGGTCRSHPVTPRANGRVDLTRTLEESYRLPGAPFVHENRGCPASGTTLIT